MKKKFLVGILLSVMMALTFGLVACDDKPVIVDPPKPGAEVKVTLDQSTLELGQNATAKVKAKVENTKEDLVFTSSDKSIFIVKYQGFTATLTGKGLGSATLTAEVGGKKATCAVTVVGVDYVTLDFEKMAVEITPLPLGDNEVEAPRSIKAEFTKATPTTKVVFTSSNNDVVTVDNSADESVGLLTPKKAGYADVTATVGKYSSVCRVEVPTPGIKYVLPAGINSPGFTVRGCASTVEGDLYIPSVKWASFKKENVKLFSNIITIGIGTSADGSFMNNKKIKNVVLGSEALTIGASAFEGSTITSVEFLGKGRMAFEVGCFQNCKELVTAKLPKNAVVMGGMPDPNSAFKNCSKLTTINLPEGISEIGHETFQNTAISSLYIPKTITSFGANNFSKVGADGVAAPLTDIHYGGTEAQWDALIKNSPRASETFKTINKNNIYFGATGLLDGVKKS